MRTGFEVALRRGSDVVGHGRGRYRGRQVQHDAQLAAGAIGAQRLQRQAVAEQQVVGHLGGDVDAAGLNKLWDGYAGGDPPLQK